MNDTNKNEVECEISPETEGPRFHEHSLIESAVTEASRELQVSREMAMMCAFGAMATACQGQIDVELPPGLRVPTSLMLLTIAESGERKTTTQNYFFGAINGLNETAYNANKEALLEYKVRHKLWTTQKRHLEREYSKCAAQDDTAATSAALKTLEDYIRKEPPPDRSNKFLYEDTTPQALMQMLYENTPNGCLLTSEANSIFSGRALTELDKLNTLWDGKSVIVDRISREGFILQNARLTLSLMAQPSVIARFMGKRGEEARGTGFLARFLIARPDPMAGQRTDTQLSALPRRDAFNKRASKLMESAVKGERQVVHFSEKAKNRWSQYNHDLEKQMQENGLYHYLKDHASKLLENTSRLAAVLHTFERTSEDNIEIDDATLKFCWKFAKNCSKHFIENLADEPQLVTDANNLAHFLLREAHKKPTNLLNNSNTSWNALPANRRAGVSTSLSLTTIKQSGPNSLRGRANAERLELAITTLTKLGHIRKKAGSHYEFSEAILLRGDPELKNGEFLTIKELPMFSEQVFFTSTERKTYFRPQYLIIEQDN